MKAMLLTKPALIETAPLQLTELPIPEIGDDELLIRVSACGVCHTDLHIIEGELPSVKLPIIPGHQVVGTVEKVGSAVTSFKVGERVGVPWLYEICGKCEFCLKGAENLCVNARFTGRDVNGGYAEFIVTKARFTYRLSHLSDLSDIAVAPLLCAGVIGFRALRMTGLKQGESLGLYGFGASAHIVLQLASAQDAKVYVFTRSKEHQELASSLGAKWVGHPDQSPPQLMDSAIIFAPAGELVPLALKRLKKGGRLILAGIHMSPIPQMPYSLLYDEREIKSVANSTPDDVRDFLKLAGEVQIKTITTVFPLEQANQALQLLKQGRINGSAVLSMR